jgi:hypothetical protein
MTMDAASVAGTGFAGAWSAGGCATGDIIGSAALSTDSISANSGNTNFCLTAS